MGERRPVLFAIIAIAVAALVLILIGRREQEPAYRGQSLSHWVDAYGKYGSTPETSAAIHHFGTNALPYLIRWIQYHPPKWKTSFGSLKRWRMSWIPAFATD